MKNTNSSLLTVGALALLIFGCVTYDLSPKDEAWNPYEVGDKFTFVSDKNNERTFTISNVEKTTNRVNVYAGNLSKLKESLTVFAIEENGSPEEFPLLTIFKNSQDQSFLNFNFALPEMLEINHVEEISDANSKLESANGFSGNDFLNISPVLNVSPDVSIPYVTNFIFSKSTGFVQFSLTNGEVWNLKLN
ncbi:MAG: hypothetical protein NWQ46_05800 [Spirosomaceae bacterium]|nr:hypothetical protein [Spirosomataceae bacterium]